MLKGQVMTSSAPHPRLESLARGLAGSRPAASLGPSTVGTRRRLRALAARSWSPRALEKETGIPAEVIKRELDGYDDLAANLMPAVAAVYDRLWDLRPPAETAADRRDAQATAAFAARQGWAPPLAWDDDLIDLPGAQPASGWRRKMTSQWRAGELVEDVEFLRDRGGYRDAGMELIATRLGINRNRIDKAYERARRYAARDAARSAEPEAEAG
jgi:hypothetical protein